MTQLDLLTAQTINAPYQPSSDTSIEAAVAAGPSAEPQKMRILRYLAKFGPRTQDELAVEMFFERQTMSARVNALFKDGSVEKTGEKRLSRFGANCAEYVITAAGREKVGR